MKYQIIGDSALDLNDALQEDLDIKTVPFTIYVEGEEFVDDDRSKIPGQRAAMNASKEAIKTACPSPFDFTKVIDDQAPGTFIITISKALSGSYNAASLAVKDYLEAHPGKKVHVFDSKSASAGQTRLALYLDHLRKQDLSFEEIVEKGEAYIQDMKTFFILESLDNLIKNGRIKKSAGLIAKTLKIKPIMEGKNGEIALYEMNRGFKKSLMKLADSIKKEVDDTRGRIMVISHSNGKEKAQAFKDRVQEAYEFEEIYIMETSGLSSAYADDGGIVVAY